MTRYLYNPEGFDPARHLPARLWRHSDSARYFIHAIEATRVYYHRPRTAFQPLKAAYLNAIMSRWVAKDIRASLEGAGVVECDHHYVEGRKSYGYRLGPGFRESIFRRFAMPPKIAKRLEKHRAFTSPRLPVHRHLYHWLTRIGVDYEDALNSFKPPKKLYHQKVALDMLSDGEFFFIADDYGRVHTNVSSLSRSLRPFLHFGGERLVHLDICCSQPFFLSLLLLNLFANGKSINSFYSFSSSEGVRGRAGGSITIDNLSILRRKINLRGDLTKDVNEFVSLAEKGVLYEELMSMFGLNTRVRAKNTFFATVLYNRRSENRFRSVFRDRFPNVDAAIWELKEHDYRRLAHHLQRCESALMIHGVCDRLRVEMPEAPVLTIHDSLLTTKPYLASVRMVLKDEFKAFSLSPSIKEEDFTLAA